ncbi:MAG: imidazolonepropionase [Chthonomonas sp.]|nr:imidazolonepropionase [Chthonomonas sp.]
MSEFAIIHASLLTMGDRGLIRDGAMMVRDGRISWIGATNELAYGGDTVDARGGLVSPGFVDSHTHLVFAGHRAGEFDQRNAGASYQEIAAAGGGIKRSVEQVRAASTPELTQQATRHAEWLLANGTTSAEVKSGYGLSLTDELRLLEVAGGLEASTGLAVSPTFLGAHAVPTGTDGDEYLAHVLHDMLPAVKQQGLARAVDMFVEDRYFTPDAARKLAAHRGDLALRLHVDQFGDAGGAALAVELGAQSADHLEFTGEAGIRALAASNTVAGLLPASVAALGRDHYANARSMLDAGCRVALATDFNPGTAPYASMASVMHLARLHMGMTAMECWQASTIRGAESLGWAADRGSLELGKRADLVLWDVADPEEIGYWVGVFPRKVWVAGNLRVSR